MNLSGCQAVIYIKERQLNALLKGIITCFGSHFRASARLPVLKIEGETIEASGTIWLADAIVRCVARSDNAMTVTLIAFSRVSGHTSEQDFVDLALRVAVVAEVPIELKSTSAFDLSPVLDLSNFTISRATVDVLDDAISGSLRQLVLSDDFALALAGELRKIGGDRLRITVPTSQLLSAYARLIASSQVIIPLLLPIGLRVLAGCVAIPFGVLGDGAPNPGGLAELPWTEYDRAVDALTSIEPGQRPARSGTVDVVAAIDSAFAAKFFREQVSLFMRLKAPSSTFQVTHALCTLGNGSAFFDLGARQEAVTGTANLRLRFGALVIDTPVGPRPVLRNLNIEVNLGLFDSILAAVADFFGFASTPEQIVHERLVSPTLLPILDLTYQGTVPRMPALDPDLPVPSEFARRGLEFSIGFAAALFQPVTSFASALATIHTPVTNLTIEGPNKIRLRDRHLDFLAHHPDLRRDPSLWLVWRILDPHGNVQWSDEDWAQDNFGPKRVDLFVEQAVQALRVVRIECLIFRGRTNDIVMSARRDVTVDDKLDRSKPYIQRSRGIGWDKKEIVDGQLVTVRKSKIRRGAIHKTRFPGRCLFADAFSSEAHWVTYMDELPDPIGTPIPPEPDGTPSSRRLCPYCFR